MMKVLNVCRVLWTGGVQRVSIEQTLALRDLGQTCDLVFLRATNSVRYVLPEGTRIVLDQKKNGERQSNPLFRLLTSVFAGHRGEAATVDLDLIWDLRKEIIRYDVAVFNDQYAALIGAYLRLTKGQPYVMMFHEFYPRVSRSLSRRLFFPVADLIDFFSILMSPAIVTTSEKSLRRLEQIVPGRTTLARIGCPPFDPTSIDVERDPNSVVALTVWDEGRHPEFYLDLARSAPAFRFTLMGQWTDSTYHARIKQAASDLPNVEITGPVTETEKNARLRSVLIFASFGYNEAGPGMGGLEAMANGAIVLANRGIGLSEIIIDGVNGFVVDPFDVDHVRDKLSMIHSLGKEKQSQILLAALKTCQKYSWHAHGLKLQEALNRALATRGSRHQT